VAGQPNDLFSIVYNAKLYSLTHSLQIDWKHTRNSSRMRYSERELYDDVVYALYEIKKREENNKHTATQPKPITDQLLAYKFSRWVFPYGNEAVGKSVNKCNN